MESSLKYLSIKIDRFNGLSYNNTFIIWYTYGDSFPYQSFPIARLRGKVFKTNKCTKLFCFIFNILLHGPIDFLFTLFESITLRLKETRNLFDSVISVIYLTAPNFSSILTLGTIKQIRFKFRFEIQKRLHRLPLFAL